MRDSYKFIDLFCGIGGFRLGFEKNNFKCVFSSDNNKNCQKVYKNNFGEDVFGDIKKIDISKIPRFDVLTAGFPCQPFVYLDTKKVLKIQEEHFLISVKLLKKETSSCCFRKCKTFH